MFVQVHVQVHAFPRVCLKTMLGERAGTIVGQFGDDFRSIVEHFASTGHHFGTTGHQL